MDFFEAQSRAKKKTGSLLFLFACAVIGMSVAGYVAIIFILNSSGDNSGNARAVPFAFWQPEIAVVVFGVTAAAVGLGSLTKWASLRQGGRVVAEMLGGTRVAPNETEPAKRQLLNVVEEMAIASGVPVPAVYVLENEPSINAFAAGYSPNDAVVAVSRGSLDYLTRDELQAVVGHEFSHILNGDMRLNLKLTALIFGILLLALIGRGFLSVAGSSRSSSRKKDGGAGAMLLVGLVVMLLGYIGYFFGRLIQAAVSRQREFLADASAVQFTRNPQAMTGALNKIRLLAEGSAIRENKAMEVSHIFFAKCYDASFLNALATHPPLEERIRAIDAEFDFTASTQQPARVRVVNEARKKQVPPPPPIPARAIITGAILAGAGALDAQKIETAHSLLAGFPPELDASARNPEKCAALIFAFIFSEKYDARNRQEKILTADFPEALAPARVLLRGVSGLEQIQRLPLLQIAAGTVRELSGVAQDRLVATAQKLVDADNRITIFEYALLRVLKKQIQAMREPRRVGTGEIKAFDHLTEEVSVVLSFIAHAGASELHSATDSFAVAQKQLPEFGGDIFLIPAEECNFRRLDAALATLNNAHPDAKKIILHLIAEVAGTDGEINASEAELIRAIALTLDCPMPVG